MANAKLTFVASASTMKYACGILAQNERSTDEHKTARMQSNSAPGGAWPADLHVLTFLARYFLPVGANRYADTCEGIGGERWAHQDPCDQVGTRFGHHLVWVGSVRAVPG